MGCDFCGEALEGFPSGFDEDVCGGWLFYCAEGDEDDFCAFDLRVSVGVFGTGRSGPLRQLTLALLINSFVRGLALCSRVSRTRVRGLAVSRRLSSFSNRSRL